MKKEDQFEVLKQDYLLTFKAYNELLEDLSYERMLSPDILAKLSSLRIAVVQSGLKLSNFIVEAHSNKVM